MGAQMRSTYEKQKTGKTLGKDSKAGKATFVSLLGLDEAKSRSKTLVSNACDCLKPFGARAEMLKQLATFIITRSY